MTASKHQTPQQQQPQQRRQSECHIDLSDSQPMSMSIRKMHAGYCQLPHHQRLRRLRAHDRRLCLQRQRRTIDYFSISEQRAPAVDPSTFFGYSPSTPFYVNPERVIAMPQPRGATHAPTISAGRRKCSAHRESPVR